MSDRADFQPPRIGEPPEWLDVEGGVLAVNDSGNRGNAVHRPMILVHGWACNRHSLAEQYHAYRQSRRVIALDLRGHGESAEATGPYAVSRFARDVLELCVAKSLERPVLVGHSMGGAVALEAERLSPGLASAVVLLDGWGCYPDEQRDQIGAMLLEQIEAVGLPAVMEQVVNQAFFLDGAAPELVAWVEEQLTVTREDMAVETYRDLLRWDGAGAASACGAPVLNLVATTPFNLQHRFLEVCPGAVGGQTVGAGHFHVIEVPDQVHLLMDAFLDRVEAGLEAAGGERPGGDP